MITIAHPEQSSAELKTFLQCYIEIGPVVSDKKIIKVFYIDI